MTTNENTNKSCSLCSLAIEPIFHDSKLDSYFCGDVCQLHQYALNGRYRGLSRGQIPQYTIKLEQTSKEGAMIHTFKPVIHRWNKKLMKYDKLEDNTTLVLKRKTYYFGKDAESKIEVFEKLTNGGWAPAKEVQFDSGNTSFRLALVDLKSSKEFSLNFSQGFKYENKALQRYETYFGRFEVKIIVK